MKYILHLKNKYNLEVGLSDHTLSSTAAIAAIALGASAIEKHFTIDKGNGPDSDFSLDQKEFKDLVNSTNIAWLSLGNGKNSRTNSEIKNKKFRRSVYFVRDLKAGSIISEKDIRRIRPSYGLAPKYYEEILGSQVLKNVEAGDPVTWESIKRKKNIIN